MRCMGTAQEGCMLYWTNSESHPQENNSCRATNFPSQKPSKEDEEDMRGTAEGAITNS